MSQPLRLFNLMGEVQPKPNPEMHLRTTLPNPEISPSATGANLMKVVEDYGKVEDEELEAEITKLEIKLARARLRREYIQKLQQVVHEFNRDLQELEQGVKVFIPR